MESVSQNMCITILSNNFFKEMDEMLMVRQILNDFTFCGKCFAKTFGTDTVC